MMGANSQGESNSRIRLQGINPGMAIRLIEEIQLGSRDAEWVEHEISSDAEGTVEEIAASDLDISAVIQLAGVRTSDGSKPTANTGRETVVFLLCERSGGEADRERKAESCRAHQHAGPIT